MTQAHRALWKIVASRCDATIRSHASASLRSKHLTRAASVNPAVAGLLFKTGMVRLTVLLSAGLREA